MLEELQKELSKFGKEVIKQSRANLTRMQHKDTNELYNSLKFESKVSKNSFSFDFLMEEYGAYNDKGVKGNNSSSRAPQSPFRFGSGRHKIGKANGGMSGVMAKWARRKSFQWKDKKSGKFMSHKSMGYLIARSIYSKGMKPSLFFTKPFEKAFKRLPDDLVEKFGLDVEQFMKNTLNKK